VTNNRVGLAVELSFRSASPDEPYRDALAVARLIRQSLLQAGLGKSDPEAPLRDIIQPGMKVLMKPNWVFHRNVGGHSMACMITRPEFILAAFAEVLKARPGHVLLGDAPIQSCQWGQIVTADFQSRLADLGRAAGAKVDFVDFRRTVIPTSDLRRGVRTNVRSRDRFVLFDLGADSLLESISRPPGRFRVACYDPKKLAETHYPGTHQFLLCREAFEADVVLSLPKLKLHRKAGLTGALKNLVGLNGSKEFLPHHKLGGTESGGDCYPGRSALRRFGELLYDHANRRIGRPSFRLWNHMAAIVSRLTTDEAHGHLEGSWHGNDTCWRMVLDLNRILLYGRPDGTLADAPQRKLCSLTDAIVCGEGEGPLHPEPLNVGAVTFSESTPAADAIHAALLRLDYRRLALVREAFGRYRWPLTDPEAPPVAVMDGREFSADAVAEELGVAARPPAGWAGHVEWTGAGTWR